MKPLLPRWASLAIIGAALALTVHFWPYASAQDKPLTTDATHFSLKADEQISISSAMQAELAQAATAEDLISAQLERAKASKLAAIYKAYAVAGVKLSDYDIIREPNNSFHFQRRKPEEKKPAEAPAKP